MCFTKRLQACKSMRVSGIDNDGVQTLLVVGVLEHSDFPFNSNFALASNISTAGGQIWYKSQNIIFKSSYYENVIFDCLG